MIDSLMQQFTGSGEAAQLLGQLQQQGLSPDQAKGVVTATAEGAAEQARGGGLAGLLGGGGGVAGALGGLLGGKAGAGGGLGGLLGGLGGGGGAAGAGAGGAGAGAAGGVAGLPPAVVQGIAATVAQKTGLSPTMAQSAVGLVLPKLVEFVKGRMGANV